MSGTPLTIVIADDHAVVRQGLRLLLEAEDDLAVVGESSDVRETCALLRECTPSVVLLDLHMGRELSLSALFEIRGASPDTAVVILTMEVDPAIGGLALSNAEDAVLTDRELEVLRLVALGHTNSEIATKMYISPRTVETHRANLQSKLGITARPELVRYALEHGVIHR